MSAKKAAKKMGATKVATKAKKFAGNANMSAAEKKKAMSGLKKMGMKKDRSNSPRKDIGHNAIKR